MTPSLYGHLFDARFTSIGNALENANKWLFVTI